MTSFSKSHHLVGDASYDLFLIVVISDADAVFRVHLEDLGAEADDARVHAPKLELQYALVECYGQAIDRWLILNMGMLLST